MWNWSQRGKRARRTIALASVVVVLGLSQMSSTAAENLYPGLPPAMATHVQWGGVAQTGLTESAKAKQWARLPLQAMAADLGVDAVPATHPECPAYDNGEGVPVPIMRTTTTNLVYFVAPSGAEYTYGLSVPMGVRTVAFGSIPAEATIQIEQPRDEAGLPRGIDMSQENWGSCGTGSVGSEGAKRWQILSDAHISADIHVRVTKVVVDGQDLGLRSGCRTPSSRLAVVGTGGRMNGDPVMDPDDDIPSGELTGPNDTDWYTAGTGGRLSGTADIGAFANCVTKTGEDVSALLTGMISGPGNPVVIQVGGNQCFNPLPGGSGIGPPPPGTTDPVEANCPATAIPDELPYPERDGR